MELPIRRANTGDIPAINELLNQVNLVHHLGRPDLFKKARKYTDQELTELLADDERPVFVACGAGGRVLGYCFCIFQRHPKDNILTDIVTLYIDDLCVLEDCRREGIGKALYAHVVDFAKTSGCHNITLNVWALNPGAQKFYEKLGMKPLKIGMEQLV